MAQATIAYIIHLLEVMEREYHAQLAGIRPRILVAVLHQSGSPC